MINKPVIVNNTNGVSTMVLITLVFFILKVLGYLQWSWLWILSPLWIPIVSIVLIVVVGLTIAVLRKNSLSEQKHDTNSNHTVSNDQIQL